MEETPTPSYDLYVGLFLVVLTLWTFLFELRKRLGRRT